MTKEKTHYRKAFNSPYLSSADIVEPVALTIARVRLEADKSKKTKDLFNTAYFAEKELRPGETLKPMILNAGNSKTMKQITGSPFIDDWIDVRVNVFVDHNVRFGKETVEGLRIAEAITEAEVAALQKMIEETGTDKSALLRFAGAESLDRITAQKYAETLALLERKRARR